ncbi:MAG TPA: hypothetical protein VHU44_18450 [Acidobacteriaceae bacterium]|nr:hypothetical protein [Acidobacteriaceae bacterium]
MSEAGGSTPELQRIVAVDWSGDRSAAGQRKKIWAGVWTRDATGRVAGGSVRLESGRTRVQLVEWLIDLAHETPRMVVGIDCCFSFPAWFLAEHGCGTVFDFWTNVADGRGEEWLHRDCADARFWGVTGIGRNGKRPAEFWGDGARRMMRSTDWENKIAVRQEGGETGRAEKMRGITPKSPFQIGGSGSVGTGSLRAMPALRSLRAAGFRVWPFESAQLDGRKPKPLLIEMYARLLTGPVAKRNTAARRAYLSAKRKLDDAYARLSPNVLMKAYASEDAFDALVCCLEMVRWRNEFTRLRATADETLRLEGITWWPGVQ